MLYTGYILGSHFYRSWSSQPIHFLGKFGFWVLALSEVTFSGFHLEETMVGYDFIIELSEDRLVVIN